MDVSKGGFPKQFVAEQFQNGILKNSQKIKLLLILIYADKMGRKPRSEKAIQKNDEALITASNKSKEKTQQKPKKQYSSPDEMRKELLDKGMEPNRIDSIVKNTFSQ
jgi:cysteinyl-tRNA synthetase